MEPAPTAPVNPLPWSVVLLVAIIIGIELIFFFASAGIVGGQMGISWRVQAIEDYAFADSVFEFMMLNRTTEPGLLLRFVSYGFVHLGMLHAVLACVFILALGKFVGEALGASRVLIVFLGALVGGALIYALVVDNTAPLIGAYPGAYGLIGAFTYIMLIVNEARGEAQATAFRLIGILMSIQIVFALLFGGPPTWIADLGGALIGFLLAFLLTPGALVGMFRRN